MTLVTRVFALEHAKLTRLPWPCARRECYTFSTDADPYRTQETPRMIEFTLTDEQEAMRELAHTFAVE